MRNRHTIQRLLSLLLIICMLFSLGACTNTNSARNETQTKIIIDCLGNEVEIPKDPQRVACLYASTAHMIAMLDEQEIIVGAPNGVKRDVLMQMKMPDIQNLSVPFQSNVINVEELLSENADLVLIRYTTASTASEIEKLEKLGIPYVCVDYANIEELRKAITLVGEIFNEEDKATAYLNFFDDTISLVQDKLQNLPADEIKTTYHSVNEAVRTDKTGDIVTEIFELAKVGNIAVGQDLVTEGDKTYITLEEIYKWNPEYIVANEYSVTNYILTDNKWAGLSAVENQQVYTLPVGATRWCHPGSMEAHMGVLALANIFYPDYFSDFDYKAYIQNYYKDYFNLTLTNEQVDMIISGNGMREAK